MTEEYGSWRLREKVIAIICEEWPNPDNQLESTNISERLKSEGVEVPEAALHDVLRQLADHGDIQLMFGTSPTHSTGMTIRGVRRELCQ